MNQNKKDKEEKQGNNMIDEKKIKEAADEYCAHLFSETIPRLHRQSWSDDTIIFKAGINWFKGNLWHDAKVERPTDKSICLCYDKFYKQYRVLMYDDKAKYWCDAVIEVGEHVSDYGDYRITRWLYISDLMKGGEG